MVRKRLMILLCILLLAFGGVSANAQGGGGMMNFMPQQMPGMMNQTQQLPTNQTTTTDTTTTNTVSNYSDVAQSYWAYDSIQSMSRLGILSGYGNGSFGPNDTVTRAEFAKMLVLTLDLDTDTDSDIAFSDVAESDWSYPYIMAAKDYLTAYSTSTDGVYSFLPDMPIVREDVAYAIVKALDYDIDDADLDVLDDYDDADEISDGLESYIALAVEEEIMVGDDGAFNPQDSLTRAQAATLLYRLISGEKLLLEDADTTSSSKVTLSDADSLSDYTPYLSYDLIDDDEDDTDDYVTLEWNEVDDTDFEYYIIAISDTDATPSYDLDDDTYTCLDVVDDVDDTTYDIEDGTDYYDDGDTLSLDNGTTYYVRVFAVYEDAVYKGDVEEVTLP